MEDLYSRRIAGWATSRSIDSELVLAALNQAARLRSPTPGGIVHSDRGSRFSSKAFRSRLARCGLAQSMSRKGNCYDNAPMERFFKSYKREEVREEIYGSYEQAARAAAAYIERFYNRSRLHSALGHKSLAEIEDECRLDAADLPLRVISETAPDVTLYRFDTT